MRFFIVCWLLFLLPFANSYAASVTKCLDSAGRVTFVKNANCPNNTAASGEVSAHNAAPSGSSAPVVMAEPKKQTAAQRQSAGVIGGRTIENPPATQESTVSAAPARSSRSASQPCVRTVERVVSGSQVAKDGKVKGRARMIKQVVPC